MSSWLTLSDLSRPLLSDPSGAAQHLKQNMLGIGVLGEGLLELGLLLGESLYDFLGSRFGCRLNRYPGKENPCY